MTEQQSIEATEQLALAELAEEEEFRAQAERQDEYERALDDENAENAYYLRFGR